MQTEFLGAVSLSSILYDILSVRDPKITSCFSKLELQYVTLLSSYYRAALVVNQSKSYVIHGMGFLKESIADILLPDVLCQYIECIGYVSVSSGITVVPWFRPYGIMQRDEHFIDCYYYLTPEQRQHISDSWSINDEVISKVSRGMSRALKSSLELRAVKAELNGDVKMLTAWRASSFGRITPLAPEKLDIAEANLGACFMWREDAPVVPVHGFVLPMVHEGSSIVAESYLTRWIHSAMRS